MYELKGTWVAVGTGKLKLNLHKTTKKTRIGTNERREEEKRIRRFTDISLSVCVLVFRLETAAKEVKLNSYLYKQLDPKMDKDAVRMRFLQPVQFTSFSSCHSLPLLLS